MAQSKAIRVELEGLKECKRALYGLEPALVRKTLRKATREACRIIHKEAKALAPKGKSGNLRRALRVRSLKRKKFRIGVQLQIGKGFFKGKTFYGAFIELGSKRTPAQHFMRDAFVRKQNAAQTVARRIIVDGIEAYAKSVAKPVKKAV